MAFSQSLDTLEMKRDSVRTIRGIIFIKETRIPVRNATVFVRGTSFKTLTNDEGEFSIPNVTGEIHISIMARNYIGIRAKVSSDVDVMMISMRLDPGPNASSKGSGLAKINMAMLSNMGNVIAFDPDKTYTSTSIINKVRMLPGVEVTSSGFRIRGASSFQLGSNPLVVVDGVEMSNINSMDEMESLLLSLDPDNIANIVVIKGSGGAIYGMKGANGVIVITTRAHLLSEMLR